MSSSLDPNSQLTEVAISLWNLYFRGKDMRGHELRVRQAVHKLGELVEGHLITKRTQKESAL